VRRPHKQGIIEGSAQFGERRADRWLAHSQPYCRFADTALLEDGNGDWQQVQVKAFIHRALLEKQIIKIQEMRLNYNRISLLFGSAKDRSEGRRFRI
jgi:hypothetical protein